MRVGCRPLSVRNFTKCQWKEHKKGEGILTLYNCTTLHCAKTCFCTWTFYIHKFWSEKTFFFFFDGVGGMSSLPDGINGVSGIGVLFWPLGSPILCRWSWQLMSCYLCQTYCTSPGGAGRFRSVVLGSTAWYLGSHFAFPWRSAKGRKQDLPYLSDWKTSVSVSCYTLSISITDAFTVFNCLEIFFLTQYSHTLFSQSSSLCIIFWNKNRFLLYVLFTLLR